MSIGRTDFQPIGLKPDARVIECSQETREVIFFMKRVSIFAASLLALALTTTSIFAQNPGKPQRGERGARGGKLKQMDANMDGVISREEWTGNPGGFARADRNNDGGISREEAMEAARQHGQKRGKEMDANNDQRISREEWKGKPKLFGRLDADNDGVLTTEELKARRRNP
jgi:EF hand